MSWHNRKSWESYIEGDSVCIVAEIQNEIEKAAAIEGALNFIGSTYGKNPTDLINVLKSDDVIDDLSDPAVLLTYDIKVSKPKISPRPGPKVIKYQICIPASVVDSWPFFSSHVNERDEAITSEVAY